MKTRLTHGNVHSNVFHRLFPKWNRRATLWAINLKPGDVFNSFDSLNHVVKEIRVEWHAVPRSFSYDETLEDYVHSRGVQGSCIDDVTIFSTNGMQHSLSETGCIVPAWSREMMRFWMHPEAFDWLESVGVIDAHGVRLRWETDGEKVYITGPLDSLLKEKYGEWQGRPHPEWYADYVRTGVMSHYPPLSVYKKKHK